MANIRGHRRGEREMEEEIRRLREALRPFARLADEIDAAHQFGLDDDDEVYSYHGIVVTVGDLRFASAAARERLVREG